MPIITLAQAKTLLQISTADTSNDALIEALIPIVQKQVVQFCHNEFLNYDIQITSSRLTFTNDTVGVLTDLDSRFLENLFIAGDYKIDGSYLNDGIWTFEAPSANEMKLSAGTFRAEAANATLIVTLVDWPQDIQPAVAQVINYNLQNRNNRLVKSESLPGGYSITYATDSSNSLESLYKNVFGNYRKPYFQ